MAATMSLPTQDLAEMESGPFGGGRCLPCNGVLAILVVLVCFGAFFKLLLVVLIVVFVPVVPCCGLHRLMVVPRHPE